MSAHTILGYRCRCECEEHPDCKRKKEPWLSACGCPTSGHKVSCSPPARCSSCLCRTWNRDALPRGLGSPNYKPK